MTCAVCNNHGIVKLNWSDAPEEYALCLCASGLALRRQEKPEDTWFPWQVWAAKSGVEPSKVFLLEEVLTPEELRERGLSLPSAAPAAVDREAALLAIGKRTRL